MSYLKNAGATSTPQSKKYPGTTQVENSAGGYSWEVSEWERLQRFLVLGTEGGSYYAGQAKLTKDNVKNVLSLIGEDGVRVVNQTVAVSVAGRAPKNDPAILTLALAAAHGNLETRLAAMEALPNVCRIPTHLFMFLSFIKGERGWGSSLKRGVAKWYENADPGRLAYHAVKYRAREGWSHRDALRLSHPRETTDQHHAIYNFMCGREAAPIDSMPAIIEGFLKAQKSASPQETASLVREYNLPREALLTDHLSEAVVWEALLPNMPMTAMIRNLGNMSKVGLLSSLSAAEATVNAKLANKEAIEKSRVHPIQVLAALLIYSRGAGARGKGSWTPVRTVVDALDAAFYTSFGNVEPIGKPVILALDVSSSMGCGGTSGIPDLTPAMASAAMLLITASVEPSWAAFGFSHQFVPLTISPRQRLDDVVRHIYNRGFGGTDCGLPMRYALEEKREVDGFVVYTDSETWCGRVHPFQALKDYRSGMQRPHAKLAVVAMQANEFSIADPNDPGMLDFVGFDTSTPNVISDFLRS